MSAQYVAKQSERSAGRSPMSAAGCSRHVCRKSVTRRAGAMPHRGGKIRARLSKRSVDAGTFSPTSTGGLGRIESAPDCHSAAHRDLMDRKLCASSAAPQASTFARL